MGFSVNKKPRQSQPGKRGPVQVRSLAPLIKDILTYQTTRNPLVFYKYAEPLARLTGLSQDTIVAAVSKGDDPVETIGNALAGSNHLIKLLDSVTDDN